MKSSIEIAREIRNAINNGVTEEYTAAQIAEVRKPLVEALDTLKTWVLFGEPRRIIETALAQCKEKQ